MAEVCDEDLPSKRSETVNSADTLNIPNYRLLVSRSSNIPEIGYKTSVSHQCSVGEIHLPSLTMINTTIDWICWRLT